MKNTSQIFAENIKQLRIEKNFSLNEIAKKLGVSAMAISRWENQQRIPNIDIAVKFARFFNVSADYLLGLED